MAHATGVTLIVLLSLCAALCGGCSEKEAVPRQIIGSWTTDSSRHVDAVMQITEHSIIFINGDFVGQHRITGFKKTEEGGKTVFRIDYETEGGTLSLPFYLKHVGEGVQRREAIVYKNQEHLVWTKTLDR